MGLSWQQLLIILLIALVLFGTKKIRGLGTDLGEKDDRTQERLINWGYALCDASVRTWFDTSLPPPRDFPYPASAV
jgi:NTE family protein